MLKFRRFSNCELEMQFGFGDFTAIVDYLLHYDIFEMLIWHYLSQLLKALVFCLELVNFNNNPINIFIHFGNTIQFLSNLASQLSILGKDLDHVLDRI